MNTKSAVTTTVNNPDNRESLDACSTPPDPSQVRSGRCSVQAAEAAIVAAVQRRFGRIGAAPRPQGTDYSTTEVVTSPLTPRLPPTANPERCGTPASPSRPALNGGDVPDYIVSSGHTAQDQDPYVYRKPAAAAVHVDMLNGGGGAAASTIVAASPDPSPLHGNGEISPNTAPGGPFWECTSIVNTPPVADGDNHVPKTTNGIDTAYGCSLLTPAPEPECDPPPGPDLSLLPQLQMSCGPELQT
ncbi:hypothetical protein Vretimale_12403, partial [Volvox reticuliferus]